MSNGKLKAYIKRVRKGDEVMLFLHDGYKMVKAKKNGYLVKSEDANSKPVFVTSAEVMKCRLASDSDWHEINGQGG